MEVVKLMKDIFFTEKCKCKKPMIYTARDEYHKFICPYCGIEKKASNSKNSQMKIKISSYNKLRKFWIQNGCEPINNKAERIPRQEEVHNDKKHQRGSQEEVLSGRV